MLTAATLRPGRGRAARGGGHFSRAELGEVDAVQVCTCHATRRHHAYPPCVAALCDHRVPTRWVQGSAGLGASWRWDSASSPLYSGQPSVASFALLHTLRTLGRLTADHALALRDASPTPPGRAESSPAGLGSRTDCSSAEPATAAAAALLTEAGFAARIRALFVAAVARGVGPNEAAAEALVQAQEELQVEQRRAARPAPAPPPSAGRRGASRLPTEQQLLVALADGLVPTVPSFRPHWRRMLKEVLALLREREAPRGEPRLGGDGEAGEAASLPPLFRPALALVRQDLDRLGL